MHLVHHSLCTRPPLHIMQPHSIITDLLDIKANILVLHLLHLCFSLHDSLNEAMYQPPAVCTSSSQSTKLPSDTCIHNVSNGPPVKRTEPQLVVHLYCTHFIFDSNCMPLDAEMILICDPIFDIECTIGGLNNKPRGGIDPPPLRPLCREREKHYLPPRRGLL